MSKKLSSWPWMKVEVVGQGIIGLDRRSTCGGSVVGNISRCTGRYGDGQERIYRSRVLLWDLRISDSYV